MSTKTPPNAPAAAAENAAEKLEFQSLDYIMSDRFARYSKYIIQQRALPDARDGLKPVQRRILYSMHDLHLQHDKPYKKAARVVGDVIGKYHPHGDSSIYEALVRMAQDWKMNMPLVDMHGNKGSIDDDPAAAMRYTEVRLEKISTLLLQELAKDTVNFVPNFDDTETEPVVLPAYIPNLLLNGARGIAAGFATEIPPHNLGELLDATIAKIKNPALNLKGLMKYVKGPDFPTGGLVYGAKGLAQALERGQGRIAIVAKYEIVEEEKHHVIRISEIPYGVVKAKLVRQLDELRIHSNLSDIREVRDESDRHGISIAIVVEAKANVAALLNFLLQKTELKIYYTYNMIAIVDNAPKVMGIDKLLTTYIAYIKAVRTRAARFDWAKATKRLEIVQGFIRVNQISDQVIRVIRSTSGGKPAVIAALVAQLDFSPLQAQAIAELRLYRLNQTDVSIYESERVALEDQLNQLNQILTDPAAFDADLIATFQAIKREYARPRRTQVIADELTINVRQDDLIAAENCWISLTKAGYLKRLSNAVYQANEPATFGLKEGDSLLYLNPSTTLNKLVVFTAQGNYALISVHRLAETRWKDPGQHISDFVEISPDDPIIACLDVADFTTTAFVVLVTKMGIGKRVALRELAAARTSKLLRAIAFKKKNDQLVGVKVSNGLEDLIIITNTTHLVRFSAQQVPLLSLRATGSMLIKLEHNWVTAFGLATAADRIILLAANQTYKCLRLGLISSGIKAARGVQVFKSLPAKQTIIDIVKDQGFKLIATRATGGFQTITTLKSSDDELPSAPFDKLARGINLVCNSFNLVLSPDNDYFQAAATIPKEVRDETIHQQERKINQIFESQQEKLDAIDERKLDDILKKLKL